MTVLANSNALGPSLTLNSEEGFRLGCLTVGGHDLLVEATYSVSSEQLIRRAFKLLGKINGVQ
jgi:hypothetical protein